MPQRVYVGDKPMLVYDECVAYLDQLIANRPNPKRKEPDTPKVKRRIGRPVAPVRWHA